MHAEETASSDRKKRVHKKETPKETAPTDDVGLFDEIECEF